MFAKRVSVTLVILVMLALSVSLVLAQGPGGGGAPGGGRGPGGRGGPPGGGDDIPVIPITDGCTEVTIDIKPGNDENCINYTGGQWLITVAILTDDTFDATTVDHTTVTFEGASEFHTDRISGEPRRHVEDVDGDEDMDLVFHFPLEYTGLDPASESGTLTGETFEGACITGTDSLQMVTGGCAEP